MPGVNLFATPVFNWSIDLKLYKFSTFSTSLSIRRSLNIFCAPLVITETR